MRLLVVGKAPPISGGTAAQAWWSAYQMAAQGHAVDLVTNGGEAEFGIRQLITPEDRKWFLKRWPNGGAIRVHNTNVLASNTLRPWASPHASKLLGLSLDLIERNRPDLVIGWYLEPYAWVAAVAAELTGLRCAIVPYSYDLVRLARHSNLRSLYRRSLHYADAVVMNRISPTRLGEIESLGVPESRVLYTTGRRLPDFHRRKAKRLVMEDVASEFAIWARDFRDAAGPLIANMIRLNEKVFRPNVLTVGTYGKLGPHRSHDALARALRKLAEGGVEFQFVALPGGSLSNISRFCEIVVRSAALAERSWLLPPLPPWRIPSLLAICEIVCLVETPHPVLKHKCRLLREVLAAGRCTVTSEDVVRHMFIRDRLVHDQNVVLAEDLQDADAFAVLLQSLMDDEAKRQRVAHYARALGDFLENEIEDSNPLVIALKGLAGNKTALASSQ